MKVVMEVFQTCSLKRGEPQVYWFELMMCVPCDSLDPKSADPHFQVLV